MKQIFRKGLNTILEYKVWIASSAFCFTVWLFFLLSFWPGISTVDSLNQFNQAITNHYTSWHPVFDTLNIRLLFLLHHSPATIAFYQIVVLSLIVGYGFYSINKYLKVNKIVIFLSVIIVSLSLINGMMVIMIWKDVLYSSFVLLFAIFVFNIIISNGVWLNSKANLIMLCISGSLISLYRYNGFPVPIITIVLLIVFYRKYWKRLMISSLIILLTVITLQESINKIVDVQKDSSQSIGVTFLHPIDAYVSQINDLQNVLSEKDLNYLDAIYPLSKKWEYSCYDATVFFYKGVSFAPIQKDPVEALDIF